MGRPPKPQPPPRRPNPITNLKPVRKPTQTVGDIARKAMVNNSKRRVCPVPTCASSNINEEGTCENCGAMIRNESQIVSEVQFGENSSGAAIVQGSYVGADQTTAKSLGPAFRRAGGGENKEKSYAEAQGHIRGMGAHFRIHENIQAQGLQIYKLASMHNFIQGRRIRMVAACCLYTAARQNENCTTMLIDFADACNVNVFKLGHCFKSLHKVVSINKILPVLPEDLIYRFAAKLEFGQDTELVATSAIRLAKRMAVDWMVMGRRPSGVCGACLIMAARMHNYRRTIREVVYIVKVTTHTLQKRLDEFKYTASSDMTVEQFLSDQFLESAHDPPSFYEKSEEFQAQLKRKKRKRPLELEEDENDENDAGEGREGSQSQEPEAEAEATAELLELASQLENVPAPTFERDAEGFLIPPRPKSPPKAQPESVSTDNANIDPTLLGDADAPGHLEAVMAEYDEVIEEADEEAAVPVLKPTKATRPPALRTASRQERTLIAGIEFNEEWVADEANQETMIAEIIGDPHSLEHARQFEFAEQRARLHIAMQNAKNPPKNVPMTASIEEDEFADDPEIENCLLSADEAAHKEKIWINDNKDWLREQQQKAFREKMAAMGPPKATRNRVKKPRIGEGAPTSASSPAEAAVAVAKERFWSKKINYSAIKSLFDGGLDSTTTSRVTSVAGSTRAPSISGSSVSGGGPASTRAGATRMGNSIVGSRRAVSAVGGSRVGSSVAASDVGNALLEELGDEIEEIPIYDDDDEFDGPDKDDDWAKDFAD